MCDGVYNICRNEICKNNGTKYWRVEMDAYFCTILICEVVCYFMVYLVKLRMYPFYHQ